MVMLPHTQDIVLYNIMLLETKSFTEHNAKQVSPTHCQPDTDTKKNSILFLTITKLSWKAQLQHNPLMYVL